MKNTCSFCGRLSLEKNKLVRPIEWNGTRSFWYCPDCEGYTLLPHLNDVEMNELYSTYYNDDSSDQGTNSLDVKFSELIFYLKSENKIFRVLDYGCGVDGFLPSQSAELGMQIDGFEISSKTIDILKKKFPGQQFYDPVSFDYSESTYDLIVLSDVLEHLSFPSELLQSIKQKLKSKGRIWIQQPLENNPTLFTLAIKTWVLASRSHSSMIPPYHVSLASKHSILKLIESSGFEVVSYKISETMWPAQRNQAFRSPKQFILTLIKCLDSLFSLSFRNYGTRISLLIEKKEDFKN